MRILTVEYRKLRSIPGTYDNATVGATAAVGADEEADDVLAALRDHVEGELDSILAVREDADATESRLREARRELADTERSLSAAREKWASVRAFAEKIGVELEDLPF